MKEEEEEKLKELAFKLCKNESALPVYNELVDIFEQNCLYHEVAAVIEKIWHITQEHDLYKRIGDIFFYNLRNFRVSMSAYNRYLQYKMPDFYKSYANNLCNLGYTDFEYEYDSEDYTKELINLCDRYNAIIHIMICMCKNKNYESILEIKNCLYNIKNRIDEYGNNLSQNDIETLNELKDSDKHLSEILSEEEHHNDINRFAIELLENNQRAYINIIGDLLIYHNYQSAIDFYNDKYVTLYNSAFLNRPADLCWLISDFYRDKFEFYKAIKYQKLALEIDSNKEE